jgi:hypothetical protein
LFGLLFAAGAQAQVLPPPFTEYAAKFTCGLEPASEPDDVVVGVYASSINIHNPQAKSFVRFLKKIVPAPREGSVGQPVFQKFFALGPDQADRVDCIFIKRALGLPAPSYLEGFVVLEVPPISGAALIFPELDVVAKYTARATPTGAGVSTQAVVPVVGKSIRF